MRLEEVRRIFRTWGEEEGEEEEGGEEGEEEEGGEEGEEEKRHSKGRRCLAKSGQKHDFCTRKWQNFPKTADCKRKYSIK